MESDSSDEKFLDSSSGSEPDENPDELSEEEDENEENDGMDVDRNGDMVSHRGISWYRPYRGSRTYVNQIVSGSCFNGLVSATRFNRFVSMDMFQPICFN
jgi:hypothetical protein